MEGGNQLFHFETKGTCLICLKPVVEAGPSSPTNDGNSGEGVASPRPATYSLRNLCRHLKLDMEMVRLLLNHEEESAPSRMPELKASLCQKCGTVVNRFSEHLQTRDVIRSEMRHSMEVVGGLLSEADKDASLVERFHQRMTSEITPKTFHCLRTVEELRKDMAEKSLESAKKYHVTVQLQRLTVDEFGYDTTGHPSTGTSGTQLTWTTTPPRKRKRGQADHHPEGSAGSSSFLLSLTNSTNGEQINGGEEGVMAISPKKVTVHSHRGSTFLINASPRTVSSVPAQLPSPPLPPEPLPRRFICQPCGVGFKFQESYQDHLKITHGMVLLEPEALPSIPFAPSSSRPNKFKCGICWKQFKTEDWLSAHVRTVHPGLDSNITAASTSASAYGRDLLQFQLERPNGILSGSGADDDLEEDNQEEQLQPGVSCFDFDQMTWLTPAEMADYENRFPMYADTAPYFPFTGTEVIPVGAPAVQVRTPKPVLIRIDHVQHFRDDEGPVVISSSGSAPIAPKGQFRCSACPKVFASKGNCKRHFITAHTDGMAIRKTPRKDRGIRTKCDICDKTFAHRSNMLIHLQSTHFGKRYQCQYCSHVFTYSSTMYHHRKHNCLMRPSHRAAVDNV